MSQQTIKMYLHAKTGRMVCGKCFDGHHKKCKFNGCNCEHFLIGKHD